MVLSTHLGLTSNVSLNSSSTNISFEGLNPATEYNATVTTISGPFSATSGPVTTATCEYDEECRPDASDPRKHSDYLDVSFSSKYTWTHKDLDADHQLPVSALGGSPSDEQQLPHLHRNVHVNSREGRKNCLNHKPDDQPHWPGVRDSVRRFRGNTGAVELYEQAGADEFHYT